MSETPAAVHVVDHDPAWPRRVATAIADLRAAAPGLFVELEHIGSTAVPGLAAEPVTNLMAAVPALADVRPHAPALTGLAFHSHDNAMTDRLLYVRADVGSRSRILRIVTYDSWPSRNQRILRDHLRATPRPRIGTPRSSGPSRHPAHRPGSTRARRRPSYRNSPTAPAPNSASHPCPCGRRG